MENAGEWGGFLGFLQDNGGCAEFMAEDGWAKFMPDVHNDGRRITMGNRPGLRPGGPLTYMSYDLPWANVSNAPFRMFKHWVHEGGISTPLLALESVSPSEYEQAELDTYVVVRFNQDVKEGALAAALSIPGLPVVVLEHSPVGTWSGLSNRLKRITSRRADAHVAVGHAAARLIEQLGDLPPGSMTVIHSGVPIEELDPPARTDDRFTIGMLSRHDPVKGIDLAPVLLELVVWSARHESTDAPPAVVRHMREDRATFLADVRRRWRRASHPPA